MTVKELKEQLDKFDENKEVIIKFAVSNKDEIGYILEPKIVDKCIEEVVVYSNYNITQEECDFIGQKDLKKLWEENKIEKIKEYIDHEIWLCEHDIDACCDDELEIRNHFVKRKKIFEEIQNKLEE